MRNITMTAFKTYLLYNLNSDSILYQGQLVYYEGVYPVKRRGFYQYTEHTPIARWKLRKLKTKEILPPFNS